MKRWPIKFRHILMVAGVLLLVVLLVEFNRRMSELDRLSSQLELVQIEGTAVMHTQEALLTQVAYAESDPAVEQWAYVQGRWVREGDYLVVVKPLGTPTPVLEEPPVTGPSKLRSWQVWWELFFGE